MALTLTLTQYFISLVFCVHFVVNETVQDAEVDETCSLPESEDEDGSKEKCKSSISISTLDKTKQKNRYSDKWKAFLEDSEKAKEAYKSSQAESTQSCSKTSCACYHGIIQNNLKPFQTHGITSEMIETASKRQLGVLYQIRGHQLYRERDCKFPARCSGVEHFLTKLAAEMPDMELIINVSDYPQVHSWARAPIPPVFSFSKTKDFQDIIYPAWTFWEGGPSISVFPRGLGRWDLLRKSLAKAAAEYPWDKKYFTAFFRGSRTSAERDALVYLSRENPDLADAQYTKNQAWKSDADTLGWPAAEEVSLESHCQFKYLFNYRGVAASFRFKHLFLCRSLVFHVGDEWQEFFYYLMKPWIHYIPVKSGSTVQELKSIIEFTQAHDQMSKRIAERGYKFIRSNLKLFHVNCYWKELLINYAKLVKYPVQIRSDMVRITSKSSTAS